MGDWGSDCRYGGDTLSGSDPIALWWRAVDWALYRVRMGQPIARSCEDWEVPTAKLNARFEELAQRTRNHSVSLSRLFRTVGELSMGTQIAEWQKTQAPEQLLRFTLADIDSENPRPEFDIAEMHWTEQVLCKQMQRLGLSEEQQYNLFDTIWDIADTISIQRRQDGYKEAIIKAREIMQQAQLAP